MKSFHGRPAILTVFSILALLTDCPALQFTVRNLNDSGTDSLRQAIINANGSGGADTIVMESGLSGTINLSSSLPTITGPLEINGDSDGDACTKDIVISGGDTVRIVSISNVSVTLRNLTLQDGSAGANAEGGAINFTASSLSPLLTLDTVSFLSNQAGEGGALNMNGGDLFVFQCLFSENTILDGASQTESGGAIYYDAQMLPGAVTLDFTDTTFSSNTSLQGGGAIFVRGILTTYNFTGCHFTGNENTVGLGGGAIAVFENATSGYDVDLNITSCQFDNQSGIAGGCIRMSSGGAGDMNLTVEKSTFHSNVGTVDGGVLNIFTGGNGTVIFRNSTISGNSAGTASGGGDSAFAGALTVCSTNLVLDSCTIVNNSGFGSNTFGAGVVGGADIFDGNLTLTNNIFDGNTGTPTGSQDAEAIRHSGSGTFTDGQRNLVNDTTDLELGGLGGNNIIGVSPNLGSLVDSIDLVGDPTLGEVVEVRFPNTGSPVLNAGATSLGTDQIGNSRPGGASDDIGAIEGTRPNLPEIDVQQPASNSLVDGCSLDLGVLESGTPQTVTFTIDNSDGIATLTIPSGGATASNLDNVSGFSVLTGLPLNVSAGNSATLQLQFTVVAPGDFSFDLDLANNDGNENPYDLKIKGNGVDTTPPSVTINQAAGQADPAAAEPVNFTVVFSEPVADFATGDVTLGGTAGATTAVVTGSGTTYNVAVSGLTGDGTVTATIGAGVAMDAAGNASLASTSTDNEVTYEPPTPYELWINGFFPGETNQAIVGPLADPNKDGLRNIVTFVLGGDPTSFDSSVLPTFEKTASNFIVRFRRRDDSADLNPFVQSATNLKNWSKAINGQGGVTIAVDDDFFASQGGVGVDRVNVTIPRNGAPAQQGRLGVDAP